MKSVAEIVKICGVTSVDDALLAVQYGANALGFNFYPRSPRYIQPGEALEIIERLPEEVLTVGVFVGHRLHGSARISAVQIHGLRFEDEVPQTDARIFVAVTPEEVDRFPNHELIIDSSWGRGQRADWQALQSLQRPYILSGGLTAENVAAAIRLLKPAGVDVCTGVESSPGRKDPDKLRRFLENARRAYERAT